MRVRFRTGLVSYWTYLVSAARLLLGRKLAVLSFELGALGAGSRFSGC